jgi:nicotinamidase-related amidase
MDALVIIDVQMGMFADPAFLPHEGTVVVGRIRALLDRARSEGTEVFLVQHDGGPGDPLAANGPGFPFQSELTPKADEREIRAHHNQTLRGGFATLGG